MFLNNPAISFSKLLPQRILRSYFLSSGVRAKVIYSYHSQNEDELTLNEGQTLLVIDQNLEDAGWWRGELNGRVGVFPDNFVELLPQSKEPAPPPVPAPAVNPGKVLALISCIICNGICRIRRHQESQECIYFLFLCLTLSISVTLRL